MGVSYILWVFDGGKINCFGTNNLAKVMWNCIVLSLLWVIWIERNNRIFEDRVMRSEDLFEKAKYLASLGASSDKIFEEFPFFIIVLNWKDVIGFRSVS